MIHEYIFKKTEGWKDMEQSAKNHGMQEKAGDIHVRIDILNACSDVEVYNFA